MGYLGQRASCPILLNGLKKMEYRGYDSAGIALLAHGLQVYKTVGKIGNLAALLQKHSPRASHIGIGHTRWATHGALSNSNAHPQVSASGKLAIVHNGIIENYDRLQQQLLDKGYVFQSETDTEILINFIEDIQQSHHCSLEEAVRLSLNSIVGAYAIIIIAEDEPNTLIAAKKGSPMMLGIGQDEFFIASDALPIVEYTDQVVYINDHEIAIIKDHQFMMRNIQDMPLTPAIQKLDIVLEAMDKGPCEYFMLKEIFEQPKSIADCMRGRLNLAHQSIKLGGLTEYMDKLVRAPKITIVACGTSWFAGLAAEYFLEDLVRMPVDVEYASEFRYRNPIITPQDIVLAISQSGETADTLAAIQLAKEHEATVLSICNVVGSSIARTVQAGMYTHAGLEIGVASTKSFTAQLTVLIMLSLAIGQKRGTITTTIFSEILTELATIPDKVEAVLQQHKAIQHLAQVLKDATSCLYLGRGYNYPVALEGALKLKELSYIHAEGYPAAEMKHGTMALIDNNTPVVFIAPQDRTYEKIISNIQEVKARKGQIIAIVTQGDTRVAQLADHVIEVPATYEALMPMITVIPLQLLAYYIAVERGCNVDQPRNLAKSVTVE